MRKSTISFLFPDLNVWLALSYQAHVHHQVAREWFESLPDSARLCFCRVTQIGLLRLLNTPAIMNGEVLTQKQAWEIYDHWLEDERIVFVEEPSTLEPIFRADTQASRCETKGWNDSYLLAFAQSAGFQMVTFDRAVYQRARGVLLLG